MPWGLQQGRKVTQFKMWEINFRDNVKLFKEKGQTITEYILLTAVVSLGMIIIYYSFTQGLENIFLKKVASAMAKTGP